MMLACKTDSTFEIDSKHLCRGGKPDDTTTISPTGYCGDRYEGIACATCKFGYGKEGSKLSYMMDGSDI